MATLFSLLSVLVYSIALRAPLYAVLFYVWLKWLGVKSSLIKRSAILAFLLACIETLANILAHYLLPIPYSGTIPAVIVFIVATRKLLVLEACQAVALPVSVSITGQIALGFFIAFTF